MRKIGILILLMSASAGPPARADSIPAELLGTWSVSKSGTGYETLMDNSSGNKTVWILKGEGEDNHFVIEAYGVTVDGQVYRREFAMSGVSFSDGKMRISTFRTINGVLENRMNFEIMFSYGGKAVTGEGTFSEWQEMPMGNMLLQQLGGYGMDTRQQLDSGTVSLRRISNSRVPPKSKPLPPPPPPPSYSAPPMQFAPGGGGFYMPPPAPMEFNGGKGSRMFSDPPRNTTYCYTNRHTCSNGCDPPSYGLQKDYARIESCRAGCEEIFQRCISR